MRKRIALTTVLVVVISTFLMATVGCTKRTGLSTEYDFLTYSRMEYRSTKNGDAMIAGFRGFIKPFIYDDNGKRIKDSGIVKFTKSNEITMSFYPNVKKINDVLADDAFMKNKLKEMLAKNYFVNDFTIAKFVELFAKQLLDRYIPGLELGKSEGRAEAFLAIEKMMGLKIEGNEYFLTKEFQDFIQGLRENEIRKIKLPNNLGFNIKLKLKSKKAVIKNYFGQGKDLKVIKRIATFNSNESRDDNFLIFDEYDISSHDANARIIFDNIIGNRIEKEEANHAFKNINSIMYGRIELFQLDLIGVRE